MGAAGNFAARSIQIGFVAILAGIWVAITRTGSVSPLFLPPIGLVWDDLRMLVLTEQFWAALRVTLSSVAWAYAIAAIGGILVGYGISRSRFLTDMFEPVLAGMFAVPLTLFFPLFILFFGIGPESKIAYGAIYAFFPVALNTIAGLGGVDRLHLAAARSMGASPWNMFRHVLFPSAFPVILTGLRIGFFICFAAVLGGETLSAAAGLGHNIALSAELMETARMYSWIAFVVITIVMLNMLVSHAEGRIREH